MLQAIAADPVEVHDEPQDTAQVEPRVICREGREQSVQTVERVLGDVTQPRGARRSVRFGTLTDRTRSRERKDAGRVSVRFSALRAIYN